MSFISQVDDFLNNKEKSITINENSTDKDIEYLKNKGGVDLKDYNNNKKAKEENPEAPFYYNEEYDIKTDKNAINIYKQPPIIK